MTDQSNQDAALRPINQPDQYAKLTDEQKSKLAQWIADTIEPADKKHASTSYQLKHVFEKAPGGFYVSNGQFKGAMQAAGYEAIDTKKINWSYRIKVK